MGKTKGRNQNVNHLLLVDDLKLYANSRNTIMKLLHIVTTFTNDVGLKFGEDKCAYICIKRGKKSTEGETININGLNVRELKEDEPYSYLGLDENIGYDGNLNKERIVKECKKRFKKVWKSELYAGNKVTAHNSFAVPLVSYTIGIFDWTKEELQALDKATRKIMNFTGSLHARSDIDRIYMPRKQGGRGLTSTEDMYITTTILIAEHIKSASLHHKLLQKVVQHESDKLILLSESLISELGIDAETNMKEKIKQSSKERHLKLWKEKPMHGYLFNKIDSKDDIDQAKSNQWMTCGLTSHNEGYICAMQEQEIPTRSTVKRRNKDETMKSTYRICNEQEETVFHTLGACRKLSLNLYTSHRHDQIVRILYSETMDTKLKGSSPTVSIKGNTETWWNKPISTVNKVPHNRPDIKVWDKETKQCTIIEISVPLDMNAVTKEIKKNDTYMTLINELQQMNPEYRLTLVPVIVGCLGAVPKTLTSNLLELGISLKESHLLARRLQNATVIGSLKVMKTAMRMF